MPTLEEVMAAMRATAGGRPVRVEVKEWPELYARQVLVDEMEDFSKNAEKMDEAHEHARNATRVICDADGKLLFDWRNAEHVALLGKQPSDMLSKVWAEP